MTEFNISFTFHLGNTEEPEMKMRKKFNAESRDMAVVTAVADFYRAAYIRYDTITGVEVEECG